MKDVQPLVILSTGFTTSVGLTAPASCAAIRAKLSNPSATRYMDSRGEWIMAHRVPLDQPWSGLSKLKRMAAMAIEECLSDVPRSEWPGIPLILCVAERSRPGRTEGLDDQLLFAITKELDFKNSERSIVVPHGRVSAYLALMHARRMLDETPAQSVLIVAVDSLLGQATLREYERADRLLTSTNSNGFMPGEGAGAILFGCSDSAAHVQCTGFGFGSEPANIDSEIPLRGEGLSRAIRSALAAARCNIHDLDLRIADLSGEQYYFKEASLALSRLLRIRKEEFALWHQAECIGECGALSGLATFVVAHAASKRGYTPGPRIVCHSANDSGERAAAIFQYPAAVNH